MVILNWGGAAGVLSLQHDVKQQCTVRRMLRDKLQAAQAAKLTAEKEHALAAVSAATFQHDLELLKHEVTLLSTLLHNV